ncbi:MAG: MoaD/ThiS family protein [Chloroflexota bacterium]
MAKVTVRLQGGLALPVPRQVMELEVPGETTVRSLVERLGVELGVVTFADTVVEHCLVALDGTEIGHLGGWEAPVGEGSVVSIVPAMVGG